MALNTEQVERDEDDGDRGVAVEDAVAEGFWNETLDAARVYSDVVAELWCEAMREAKGWPA